MKFGNPGNLDLDVLTTFGFSGKPRTDSPIGMFGTGLKFAVATLLRNGAAVTLRTGGGEFEFTSHEDTVRGTDVNRVWMNDLALPFTTDLGRNWEPWMAIREIYSNALDEGGGMDVDGDTVIEIDGLPDLDLGAYFLPLRYGRHEYKVVSDHGGPVSVLNDGGSRYIYYRGFAAHKLPKPSHLTYDVMMDMKLTEDRTIEDVWSLDAMVRQSTLDADMVIASLTAPHGSWECSLQWTSADLGPVIDVIRENVATVDITNENAKRVLRQRRTSQAAKSRLLGNAQANVDEAIKGIERLGFVLPTVLLSDDDPEEHDEDAVLVPWYAAETVEDAALHIIQICLAKNGLSADYTIAHLVTNGKVYL